MKQIISALLVWAITLSLLIVLNAKLGPVPPLGKFFDPFSGFWQNAESRKNYKDHELKIDGLEAAVKVVYDPSHLC